MDKHPHADIEWYDGGMTMEEQREYAALKRQQRRGLKLKITSKQKEEYENSLISKLTQEKAADNEYIAELQEQIDTLTSEVSTLKSRLEDLENEKETIKKHWTQLQTRYGTDLCTLRKEPIMQQYEETIKSLKTEIEGWKIKYETIFCKLVRSNEHL